MTTTDRSIAEDEDSAPWKERRAERQSRETLRDTLLDAAREVVQEEGIETGTSNLTFKRIFDRVETQTGRRLTNASVIGRIWRNQAEFQADVLMAIARDETRPEVDRTLQAVSEVLSRVDLGSPEARLGARRELCRIGGGASSSAIADSQNWSLWISVLTIATTTSDIDQRERIGLALAEGYESVTSFWEGIYRWLMEYLGFRPRRPMTVRQFTMAVTAMSEGCSLREHVDGSIAPIVLPSGDGDTEQEWTLFGVGLDALVNQFFETDPEFTPPAVETGPDS